MDNKTMMTDLYELTMAQVYFNEGEKDKIAVFDVFFRKEPLDLNYAIMCGVDRIIEYINELHFSEEDISYLEGTKQFTKEFLEYLKNFRFTGSLYAIPDGTPVFRTEPIVTIKAPIIEAQIVETAILSYVNSNICYATATKKITEVTKDIGVMEFGARRAFGPDAAVEASKCSIIGGTIGTSNVLAGQKYNIPILGTMAHSMITEADSEYEAFLNYAKTYPNNCVLLIDTYDTLNSGIKNAIKVARDYLIPNGYRLKGIRIDSGDLAYLSRECKKILVKEGFEDTKICLSDGLNAKSIAELKAKGAVIDSIGLGDNIVAPDKARVGCVYKNVAVYNDGKLIPRIKISSNPAKTINPGYKKVYRVYDKITKLAMGDIIALNEEKINDSDIYLNDIKVDNCEVKPLQETIFENGKLVYKDLSLYEKRDFCNKQMENIDKEVKATVSDKKYVVELSKSLAKTKNRLINELNNRKGETM